MKKYKNAYQLFLHLVDEDTSLLKRNLDELVDRSEPLYNETLKLINIHIKQKNDTLIAPLIHRNATQLLGDKEIEHMEGQQLGVYQLEKKLGAGGMSVVYLAKRNDGELEQMVAIKVIKPSVLKLTGINFLNREAQILENLKHPNVATIHNIDRTSEGLPFIVMEFVNGLPIDEFCEMNKLSFQERLKIFKTLCEAVEAVHAKAIIHADIKPSNILVNNNGVLKLMDFGIARGLQRDEQHVEIAAASINYASPEQLHGLPLSTASDVFSLGKVANKIFLECEFENFQSKRVLKWLIDQATSKQLSERKITIETLIKAIDALQKNKRVENYPYNRHEKVSFLIKANPLKIGLSTLIFVFLASLSVVTYSKNKMIRHEKNIAEETASFLESIFQFADPSNGIAYDVSLEELLDKSNINLVTKHFSDDKSEQRIRIALANAYLGLGKTEKTKEQIELMGKDITSHDYLRTVGRLYLRIGDYTEAVKIYENLLLEKDLKLPVRLDVFEGLIIGLTYLNELEKAENYITKLEKVVRTYNPENGREIILKASAYVSVKKADHQLTVELYEELLKVIDPSNRAEISKTLFHLGSSYEELGDFEKSHEMYKQAIKLDEEIFGKNHPVTAMGYSSIAYLHETMGQSDKSISTYQKAIDIFNDAYPDGHPELANMLNNQAYSYKQLGQYELAFQLQLSALEMIKKFLDESHPRIANIQNSIGVTLNQLKKYDESAKYYQLAYQSRIQSLGADHLDIHISHINLAQAEKSRKNFDEAHRHIDRAIEIVTNKLGSDNYKLINPLSVKASIFRETGNLDQAIQLELHVVEVAKKSLGEEHWHISLYFNQLSLSYFKALKFDLAIEAIEMAIQNLQKQKKYDETLLGDFYVNKGKYLFKQGKTSQSLSWLENGLRLYQANKSSKIEKTKDLINQVSQAGTQINKI
ncbi:serine/threonine-protein kinase [Marinicella gelatinilytica]|uniref:serine/threonine-protein kinase n=1 Tax=Marinicella gelatinilytica TaxID=2996017 RepID=UPI002260C03B|nr:serine/threonine-protein kinase [Marinicella gelatinilytica]MCX7544407.1 serine/threonine-protein kinase [Marinicella gelatinilytica]